MPTVTGGFSPMLGLGTFIVVWIVATSVQHLVERLRGRTGDGNWFARARGLPGGWWGMWFAHLGIAVTIVGITLVKGFEQNIDLKMAPGQTATLAGYTFSFYLIHFTLLVFARAVGVHNPGWGGYALLLLAVLAVTWMLGQVGEQRRRWYRDAMVRAWGWLPRK